MYQIMESTPGSQAVCRQMAQGPGKAVILSGPSGVGKDTVIDQWQKVNPLVSRVVTATTRPSRPEETDGVSYQFLSEDQFNQMIAAGEFLEHKAYGEHQYGTPLKAVESLILAGKIAVLKIEVEGALEVMKKVPSITSLFLFPPNRFALEHHLRDRGTPADDMERRLKIADTEMMKADRYTYRIVNHEGCVDDTVRQVESLLGKI